MEDPSVQAAAIGQAPSGSASATTQGIDVQFDDWGIRLGQRTILTGINLQLTAPGVVVLMGPAGTGKSTLLKALAGQVSAHGHYQGRLLIDRQPPEQAPRLPALVQQHPRELAMRVLDTLVEALRSDRPLPPTEYRACIEQAMHDFDQHDLLEHLDKRLLDLPRDAMRRVLMVRAALSGSRVLLIDEPTTGLDEAAAGKVLDLVRRLARHCCCVLVLHHQGQARAIADRLLLLAGGRIQVDADNAAFFDNAGNHPVLAQFLRTGSCHVPAPDAMAADLDEALRDTIPAPPAPAEKPLAQRPAPATTTTAPVPPAPATATELLPPGILPAHRGPAGFHWLIPGKLAGCPMPGAMLPLEHDLSLLRGVGITVLVNLTEQPMTDTAIPAHGLRTLHMGVEDRNAPPLMWMKMLLVRMEKLIDQGEVVAVHCLAGLGRTGTVLGAWLVREGLTAEEALRRLRAIEPGYVQSEAQEQLLHAMETNLLIRAPDL